MAQATDVMSKAAMDRLARRLRDGGLANSGALVVIDPENEDYEVAEVSAASHAYPRYPYGAEALRVYDDAAVTIALWRRWVEVVIEAELEERAWAL